MIVANNYVMGKFIPIFELLFGVLAILSYSESADQDHTTQFGIGARVYGNWKGQGRWYPGSVAVNR